MISDPSRLISACSSPTALLAASSERNELEHTSSARPSVRWASVIRWGRISCRTTGIPDLATCQFQHRIRQRPQRGGRYPSQQSAEKRSAVIGAGCNARNVRAIKTDIGQFAIAKLGQFADIALIVPERLDHADEREQHG